MIHRVQVAPACRLQKTRRCTSTGAVSGRLWMWARGSGWWFLLVGGLAAVPIVAIPDSWWYTAWYDLLGLSSVVAILVGARANRTRTRATWRWLAEGSSYSSLVTCCSTWSIGSGTATRTLRRPMPSTCPATCRWRSGWCARPRPQPRQERRQPDRCDHHRRPADALTSSGDHAYGGTARTRLLQW
jgi:hypothetical protein